MTITNGLAEPGRLTTIIILVMVILIYGSFGIYPIPPKFSNLAVAPAQGGLRLPAPGIAYTMTTPDWLITAIETSSLDISLDLQPFAVDQTGPARILTISADTALRNITVGQQGADLVVRVRRSEDTLNGIPPFIVNNVFGNLDRQTVFVSVQPGELSISVNDINSLTVTLPDDALASWALDYRLALGNEFTFDRPWLGVIYRATVDVGGNQIDYLQPGLLAIPATYYARLQSDTIQFIPFYHRDYSAWSMRDWAVNFFGFVPLGFVLVALFPGRSLWRIGCIGFAVSLGIETTQVFLPWRQPSMDDLILNTLGGVAGAALGRIVASRFFDR